MEQMLQLNHGANVNHTPREPRWHGEQIGCIARGARCARSPRSLELEPRPTFARLEKNPKIPWGRASASATIGEGRWAFAHPRSDGRTYETRHHHRRLPSRRLRQALL